MLRMTRRPRSADTFHGGFVSLGEKRPHATLTARICSASALARPLLLPGNDIADRFDHAGRTLPTSYHARLWAVGSRPVAFILLLLLLTGRPEQHHPYDARRRADGPAIAGLTGTVSRMR